MLLTGHMAVKKDFAIDLDGDSSLCCNGKAVLKGLVRDFTENFMLLRKIADCRKRMTERNNSVICKRRLRSSAKATYQQYSVS